MRLAAKAEHAARQLAKGRQVAYRVDTADVVRHLQWLTSSGLSLSEVARRAHVDVATLIRAQRRARMSVLTHDAILRVQP